MELLVCCDFGEHFCLNSENTVMECFFRHVHIPIAPLALFAGCKPTQAVTYLTLLLLSLVQTGAGDQELYVEWGSTNTTDTSVFMMKKISTH